MPIGSIVTQPDESSINSAYRPILLAVSATATGGGSVPPVVYCDVYFAGVFYKSLSLTRHIDDDGSASIWVFDVQDVCQEFLYAYIGTNGSLSIFEVGPLAARVTCKFRSSGIDADGYTVVEGTPPQQGTMDTDPVNGTGTGSNEFFAVMSSLRWQDAPSLEVHLNTLQLGGAFGSETWALTHRPNGYKICVGDSDFFPILSNVVPTGIQLSYELIDGTAGSTGTVGLSTEVVGEEDEGGSACSGVSGGAFSPPDAISGVAYSYNYNLTGDSPFVIDTTDIPAWMNANIVGSQLQLTGTPDEVDESGSVSVEVTITNCDGANSLPLTSAISVEANYMLSSSFNMTFESVTGSNVPVLPPVTNSNATGHHGVMFGTYTFEISGTPGLPLFLQWTKNGVQQAFQSLPAAGDYDFVIVAGENDIVRVDIYS